MAWQSMYYDPFFGPRDVTISTDSLKTNEKCFIRKEHKCGKIFGASKSCFIACPTNEDLEPILSLEYDR